MSTEQEMSLQYNSISEGKREKWKEMHQGQKTNSLSPQNIVYMGNFPRFISPCLPSCLRANSKLGELNYTERNV